MLKPLTCLIVSSFLISPFLLHATSSQKQGLSQNNLYVEPGQSDMWFGPGYYYGTWFDNEEDYQGWRVNHPDYPPNRDYYNHDHPVEYHPEGNRHGEENRAREGEGERRGGERGGGGRGGGGRR